MFIKHKKLYIFGTVYICIKKLMQSCLKKILNIILVPANITIFILIYVKIIFFRFSPCNFQNHQLLVLQVFFVLKNSNGAVLNFKLEFKLKICKIMTI